MDGESNNDWRKKKWMNLKQLEKTKTIGENETIH